MTTTHLHHPPNGTTPSPAGRSAVADRLAFDQTVDRTLVHREALSEVFATDVAGMDRTYVVAAQLPPSHAYYGDHTGVRQAPDLLLLLECARQAETLIVHRFLDAPPDTGFLLLDWSIDVSGLHDVQWPPGPHPLTVVDVPEVRRTGSRLRSAEHVMQLYVGDDQVGTARMNVAYLPRQAYLTVRPKRRGSVPPMSDRISTGPDREPCLPERVGRRNVDNVVLHTPRVIDGELTCLLGTAVVDHPSLFDHPQDHVPGMTLMEAARQSALLSAAEFGFGPPEHTAAISFDATFDSYTELDRATTVRAQRPRPIARDRCEVRVSVEQAADVTASATVGLRRVEDPTL